MGPHTSGSDGSFAPIATQSNGKLELNQTFTLVRKPVIIGDQMTNGGRKVILSYQGGGAEGGYHVLPYTDGYYANLPDGTPLESLEGV